MGTDDPCIRCGYDLRGVADDQPCPECGLLAERSRSDSPDLSEASPGWLRGLMVGSALLLIGHFAALCWEPIWQANRTWFFGDWVARWKGPRRLVVFVAPGYPYAYLGNPVQFYVGVYDCCALMLVIGVWLVSRPSRRGASGQSRGLRIAVRLSTLPVIAALAIAHWAVWRDGFIGPYSSGWRHLLVSLLLTIGTAPMPVLLFMLLRRLAQRVLNPRLAEHATIVAIGYAGTLLLMPVLITLYAVGELNAGPDWASRSPFAIGITLVSVLAVLFFGGWTALNCLRFILAFMKAYRGARRKWQAADRSVSPILSP